jgi:cytochrome oxidase assembly protein ShyY1
MDMYKTSMDHSELQASFFAAYQEVLSLNKEAAENTTMNQVHQAIQTMAHDTTKLMETANQGDQGHHLIYGSLWTTLAFALLGVVVYKVIKHRRGNANRRPMWTVRYSPTSTVQSPGP